MSVLSCDNLTVIHGQVVALEAVSIDVAPRERVALIGPSGAGKSSLIHAAAGLVRPTSGRVEIFGSAHADVTGAAQRRQRRRVGIISQQLALAPALRVIHSVNGGRLGSWSTARALASLVRPTGTDEVTRVLGAVGLADRINARTGDLSGGEQQRVAIARTLLQAPELVLADEPTSSVDPALADQMMSLLCPTDSQWATVVSVHNPDLALRYADRIVGLSLGRVIFDQPAENVQQSEIDSLYRRS